MLCALVFVAGMGNVWADSTFTTDNTVDGSTLSGTVNIQNGATLTVNLNGQSVDVTTINIGVKSKGAGNLIINGPGTLNVGNFDPNEYETNRIEINSYANLVVTGTFWADKDTSGGVTIVTGDRTGSLNITGSVNYSTKTEGGVFFDTVNVTMLSDVANLVKYSWDGIVASASGGIGCNVNRTFKGQANAESIFYELKFSNSSRADISGSVSFSQEKDVTETKTDTKEIKISFEAGDFTNTGDSAILTLYAPDGVTELATIAYYFQLPVWSGSETDAALNVKNWGLEDSITEDDLLALFKNNQITLNSGLSRYPVFSEAKEYVFKSLVVSSGANVTVSGGNFSAGALTVNGSGYVKTTGGTLTISGSSGNSTISNLNLGSTMNVTGGTTTITSLKTNANCSVNISNGATVAVTNSYLGTDCTGKLSWNGTGTLQIPKSGANVDYGATIPDYDARLNVQAMGAATYYSANDLSADGDLNLTRVSASSTGTVDVKYPYTLTTTTSTNSVSIGGTNYNSSSAKTGYLTVPTGVTSKTFSVSGLTSIDSGSSFIMTIYSPDGKFSLGSISYTNISGSSYTWLGTNENGKWNNNDNWADKSTPNDSSGSLTTVVKIASKDSAGSWPYINDSINLKTLIIGDGASVELKNGVTLTIQSIICIGTGKFIGTNGTVDFADGGSFTAANPDLSSFDKVTISGSFTANSKMNVTNDFKAEGLGGKTITLNDNVIVGRDLLLTGTSETSRLSIAGTSGCYFKISNTQNSGLYLSVADGLKIGENGGSSSVVYKAYYCDRDSLATAVPKGWVLSTGAPDELTWTGNSSTDNKDWTQSSNWSPKIAPSETGSKVTIPEGRSSYPVLTSDVSVAAINIEENAKITLGGNRFEVKGTEAGSFTNNGTVICTGSEVSSISLPSASGAVVENGTWQFNNGSNVLLKAVPNLTYKNVLISNTVTIDGEIVAEKITFAASGIQSYPLSSNVTLKGNVELKSDCQFDTTESNRYSLNIEGNVTGGKLFETLDSGTITLTGTADVSDLKIAGNAVLENTVSASGSVSITGNAVLKNTVSATGNILISGTTSFEGSCTSISSGGTQTYTGAVTVGSDVALVAGTSGTPSSVTFISTVDDAAEKTHSLTIGSSGGSGIATEAVFTGAIGGTSALQNLTVYGKSSNSVVSSPIVVTAEDIYFAGFADNSSLTANGNVDLRGDNTLGAVTINGNADIYGNNTFASFTLSGNANIYGQNSFTSLTIDNSGATAVTTVKFKNGETQEIVNTWGSPATVFFKGAGEGKELLLTSIDAYDSVSSNPWFVLVSNDGISRDNFSYVKVQNSSATSALNLRQKKENIVDAGNNTNWFSINSFVWKGTTNNSWENPANWLDGDGKAVTIYPDYTSGADTVEIDTADGGNSLDLAVASLLDTSVTTIKLNKITVNAGKYLGLAGYSVVAKEISVNGTVALYGTQSTAPLSVIGTGAVFWGDSSAIEYYGDSESAKDVLYVSSDSSGVKNYKKLNVLMTGGKLTFESSLNAASFADETTSYIDFSSGLTVATDTEFKGNVAFLNAATIDIPELTVTGSLTLPSGETTFSGNLDVSGGDFAHGSGTAVFSGASKTLSVNNGTTVFNNLKVKSGGSLTANGSFSAAGNVEIESGGSLSSGSLSTDAFTLTIGGNFVNSGTFVSNSGTVEFTGDSNISGENSWHNLEFKTPAKTITFEAGKTQTVSNKFTVAGTADSANANNIKLISSIDGTRWNLNIPSATPSSNISVNYASIKDSECTGLSVNAYDSLDFGNTVNWIFHGLTYKWVGADFDLWSNAANWNPPSLPGKYSSVLIPEGKSAKADIDVEFCKLQIENNAAVDLNNHKASVTSTGSSDEKITNQGTLRLAGISNQISGPVSNEENSTVEYYGGTVENPSRNAIKYEYFNLRVLNSAVLGQVDGSDLTDLKVNGNLDIAEEAGKIIFEKNLSVFGAMNASNNEISVKGDFEIGSFDPACKVSLSFEGPLAGKTEQKFKYSAGSSKAALSIKDFAAKSTKVISDVSLNVSGSWNNEGSYSASEGTVKLLNNGTISGTNDFYNFEFEKDSGQLSFTGKNTYKSLSIAAPGGEIIFPSGENNSQTINGTLTIKGSKDRLLRLCQASSSRSAAQWYINCENSSSAVLEYLRVYDSYANKATSTRLVAIESRNGGNNINWQFPGLGFALTASAVGLNQMYVVFDRPVDYAKSKPDKTLYFIDSEGKLVSDLQIKSAKVVHNTSEATGYTCELSRNISFEDLMNLYIVYCSTTENYIATPTFDFMSNNECHTISDFAINAVEPLYAYDNRQVELSDEYFKSATGIEESFAVHDWSKDQDKQGTLIYNSDVFVSAALNYKIDSIDPDKKSEKIALYFDNEPDSQAVSASFNTLNGQNLRLWLPANLSSGKAVSPMEYFTSKNNVPKGTVVCESSDRNFKFNIEKDRLSAANGVKAGDQIKFLFGLEDRVICRSPKVSGSNFNFTIDISEKSPVFAFRLAKASDISSLDLWSFRLKDIKNQRGGVTILNNVINASEGEYATVKVQMEDEGSVNVCIMTLDGNIVQYLQKGTASKGDHFYSWNGKTKSGKTVARGLYFVRVFGSGFDETRKIMVIKD